jgi:hypothetical protein
MQDGYGSAQPRMSANGMVRPCSRNGELTLLVQRSHLGASVELRLSKIAQSGPSRMIRLDLARSIDALPIWEPYSVWTVAL